MMDQATLQGNWNQIKGQLKEKWGQLTDDDLRSFNGNMDQLVGRIQSRTGESRESIQNFLNNLSAQGSSALDRGKQMAQDAMHRGQETLQRGQQMAQQGLDRSREAWGQASQRMSQGYQQAESTIQEHPTQAVAIAFAAGLLTGLGIAMILASQREETMSERARRRAENWGDYLYDRMQRYTPETLKQCMG